MGVMEIWLIFMRGEGGKIRPVLSLHNSVADYKSHKDYVGFKKITINLDEVER